MHFPNGFYINEISSWHQEQPRAGTVSVPGRAFCSLSFRISGEITIYGNNQTLNVTPSCLLYLPKGCDYSTTVTQDTSMYVIHFWTDGSYPTEPFVWKPEDPQVYENIFFQITKRCRLGARQDFTAMSLFYQLLARIRDASQSSGYVVSVRMRKAKRYIDEHFDDESLSVSLLAQTAGVSQTYFRREFKICFGHSPKEYIRTLRIEHAKNLLEAGDLSISEVALQSGYSNISYFSTDFRNATGQSPSQYRASAASVD